MCSLLSQSDVTVNNTGGVGHGGKNRDADSCSLLATARCTA
jgi:hypothetical protein